MKIDGLSPEALTLSRDTLRLRRPTGLIELRFAALPYGIDAEVEQAIPAPRPKTTGFARDARGRLLRDPDTHKPIAVTNENDPEFVAALKRTQRLQAIYMIAKSLHADPSVHFDAQLPDHENASDWCEAIEQELRAAGFSVGEVSRMISFVMHMSGLSNERIDEAREDFLSAT